MKKIICILLVTLMLITCAGCQTTTRYLGDTMDLELPAGMKLLEITWKDDSLWYLVRPMREGEVPETYEFREDSEWGAFEGCVKISEKEANEENGKS